MVSRNQVEATVHQDEGLESRSLLLDCALVLAALCFGPPGGFFLTLAFVIKCRRTAAAPLPLAVKVPAAGD